jgi:hypothetical protein
MVAILFSPESGFTDVRTESVEGWFFVSPQETNTKARIAKERIAREKVIL